MVPAQIPQRTLRSVLRCPPELAPGDSLHRFAQIMRFEPMGMLPVTAQGRLCGVLAQSDILPILQKSGPASREIEMERPVADFMRPSAAALNSRMDIEEAGRVFAESGQTMLPVLDERDYYLGVVSANDLLVPELPAPRPSRVGGMATPFGVYLTDGTVQAGVGNLALVASGVMMVVLWMLAFGSMKILFQALSWVAQRPVPLLIALWDDVPTHSPWLGLASIGESILMFVVFMLLMRLTRLAGYHAAEHQTVHAIERCELLVPGVVRRMPRAHPRCGTNLLAAALIFWNVKQALDYVPPLNGMVEIVAGLAALFVWRPVGTFLQERYTTKPADDREIASGIAAGDALLSRYLAEAPVRPSLSRRIWCSGMLQILCGSVPSAMLITVIIWNLASLQHFLGLH